MFGQRVRRDEVGRLNDFHSFLRSELTHEVRHAVKAVQKEAAASDGLSSNQYQIEVADNDFSRELLSLIEACIIHGMNKKYVRVSKKSGRETAQVDLWALMEKLLSKSDQKALKTENLQLKTKTGLARAAIRNFMNTQVLDCYIQALMLDTELLHKFYGGSALLRDPDNAEIFKNSLQGLERLKFCFSTNSPILDTWSRHTLELAAVVAPKHDKKGIKSKQNVDQSSCPDGSGDFDDSASVMSSMVTESISSMMTDFNGDEGVEVFRSKMSRRRRRAQRRNLIAPTIGSQDSQDMYDDAISVYSEKEATKSTDTMMDMADISDVDESDDWKQRTEADQAMQIETNHNSLSPLLKIGDDEEYTKKFTKIAFTEQDFAATTQDEDQTPVEGIVNEQVEETAEDKTDYHSGTESQGDIASYMPPETSTPDFDYTPTEVVEEFNEDNDVISKSSSVSDDEAVPEFTTNIETLEPEESVEVEEVEESQKDPKLDTFARLFTQEMKDDDEGLPWLDRQTEKHRDSLCGRPIAARHREGFLQRKGDWTGFWRRRYFKLADHMLTYYRSDVDETPALSIAISNMSDVIEDERVKAYCFRIEMHQRKSLFVCGYSHHDSAKWVADLRYEIEHFGAADANGYEVISVNSYDSKSSDYSPMFKNQLLVLATEFGLPGQNYRCYECETPIGIIYGPPRHCGFTGKYYCARCHDNSVSVIPARLMYNWDHSPRPICKRAKCYLSRIQHDPILDLSVSNEALYSHVPALDRVRILRIRLQKMEPYLRSCQVGKETYDKIMHGREYLTTELDKYSVSDLLEFNEDSLEATLNQCFANGKKHIGSCQTCCLKGFYCEICGSDNLIYPFDMDETSTCSKCHACFHRPCFCSGTSCPKCSRLEERALRLSQLEKAEPSSGEDN